MCGGARFFSPRARGSEAPFVRLLVNVLNLEQEPDLLGWMTPIL